MVDPVSLAPGAIKKVWSLLESEGDFSLRFRAYVTGGGCQGLQYGFALESASEADDCEVRVDVGVCSSTILLENFLGVLRRQAETLFFAGETEERSLGRRIAGLLRFMRRLRRLVEENPEVVAAVHSTTRRREFFLVVDPISLPYLTGSEIDYVIDGQGERFVIKNPHAKTTCGCDRSFALSD